MWILPPRRLYSCQRPFVQRTHHRDPSGRALRITPLRLILAPEKSFYALALIYGVAIGILTLSIPVSVQLLISTVANTAQPEPVVILAIALFVLLALSSLFQAVQHFTIELFERRFYARVTSEIVMRFIHARYVQLESINREELANRYFDIMTVQKNLPILLTGGISLALQTGVGFLVTSFYHPLLLVFNLVVIGLVALVWRVLHRGATRSAMSLSQAKYNTAGWLEELARTNSLFKSTRTIDYALGRSEELTRKYNEEHKRLFAYTFGQLVGFLALYALASAALLGLGGALVISGQLTLGQLVAAELILSAIFVGLTRLGYYLRSYYELRAATEKLAVFFDLSLEDSRGDDVLASGSSEIRFRDVRAGSYRGGQLTLNLEIPSGSKVLAAATSATLAKQFTDLLQRFRDPVGGSLQLGGGDVSDINVQRLRDEMVVINNSLVTGGSIAEYLSLARPEAPRARVREALEQVGLAHVVEDAEHGLDLPLTPYGYPLSVSETMRLKVAFALLAQPRVLVLSHLFDVVDHQLRAKILESLRSVEGLTLVYFSNRRDLEGFDRYLFFSSTVQKYVPDLEALNTMETEFWDVAERSIGGSIP